VRRYVRLHGGAYPSAVGAPGVARFLSALAHRGVSASAQNQALAALLFLYRSTTMIYTHALNRGGRGVRSPADEL
jgi:hypothetical protein